MKNDLAKLNEIVTTVSNSLTELATVGRDGFEVPEIVVPEEVTGLVGQSIGEWTPAGKNLLWFLAFKLTVHARELLEQSSRILRQLDDDDLARRVQRIVETTDEQFHPADTALRVYSKLLAK